MLAAQGALEKRAGSPRERNQASVGVPEGARAMLQASPLQGKGKGELLAVTCVER